MVIDNKDNMGKITSLGAPTFNAEKFEQVLHYIIYKTGNSDNVGKTVLFKLLYFCDFNNLEKYKEYLTGETYLKWKQGPAPVHFDSAVESLKNKKAILVKSGPFLAIGRRNFGRKRNPPWTN
jgi:hypothetical protein